MNNVIISGDISSKNDALPISTNTWCNFVLLVLDLQIYTLEKDNFADFDHF